MAHVGKIDYSRGGVVHHGVEGSSHSFLTLGFPVLFSNPEPVTC